jgi:hypothetical protein
LQLGRGSVWGWREGCGAAGRGGRSRKLRCRTWPARRKRSGARWFRRETDRSMDNLGKLGKHGDDFQGWSAAATLNRRALLKRIGPIAQVFGTVLRLSITFSYLQPHPAAGAVFPIGSLAGGGLCGRSAAFSEPGGGDGRGDRPPFRSTISPERLLVLPGADLAPHPVGSFPERYWG